MKKIFSLLIVVVASVALNVTLIILLMKGRAPPETLAARVVRPAALPVDPNIWPSLQTSELPVLVGRLRVAGFPSAMIRAVATEQLAQAYLPPTRAFEPDSDTGPFWQGLWPDLRAINSLRRMADERGEIIRALLGDDPADDVDLGKRIAEQRLIRSVPPEKRERLQQLMREVDGKQSALLIESSRGNDSVRSDAIQEEVTALERARLTAVAEILSPLEFTEHELRVSDTASSLRSSLIEFDPTAAEFRGIFELQRTFDERFAEMWKSHHPSPDQDREYRQAQNRLTEQIEGMLGPVRGEEYVRATNPFYKQTSKIVARLQLPPETANEVWATQRDALRRWEAITDDRTLAAAERNRQIVKLGHEARAKISASLGSERAFQVYEKYSGGWWRGALQPQLEPPAKE